MPVAEAQSAPRDGVAGYVRKLLHDSSHYFLGLVASILLGFISFPIFTRALSVEEYGVIDLLQKLLLVVTAISKLGLQNSALRFYDSREFAATPARARRYYSTLFFGTIAPSVLATLLFVALANLAPGSGDTPAFTAALLMAALLVVPRSVQSMFWSFLRVEERTKTYNILIVLTKAATLLAILALLRWARPSAELYFLATALVEGALVALLTVSLINRRLLSLSAFDMEFFRACFIFGMPLIVNEVAFLVLDAAGRILVQQYVGAVALGVYAVANGLAAMVQNLLLMPLNLAVLPLYMKLWNAGQQNEAKQFLATGLDVLILGCAGLFAVFAAVAREVVLLAASSKYEGAESLIPAILAGLLIFTAYVFVSAGLMIGKKTGQIAMIMGASATVNVALNCLLLPRMGLAGAAVATLVGNAFCIGVMAHFAFKIVPIAIAWKRVAVYTGAAALAWAVGGAVRPSGLVSALVIKAALAFAVYVVIVTLADARLRRLAGRVMAWH